MRIKSTADVYLTGLTTVYRLCDNKKKMIPSWFIRETHIYFFSAEQKYSFEKYVTNCEIILSYSPTLLRILKRHGWNLFYDSHIWIPIILMSVWTAWWVWLLSRILTMSFYVEAVDPKSISLQRKELQSRVRLSAP